MPIMIVIALLPLLLGAVVEYLVCRSTGNKLLRWIAPAAVLAAAVIVAAVRYFGWSAEHGGETAPIETLLLVPGIPAALLLLGLLMGWRLWVRLWKPRVVKD